MGEVRASLEKAVFTSGTWCVSYLACLSFSER